MSTSDGAGGGSQTLERGIDVLQVVVDAPAPLSVSEVAAATGLNRSVAYRLLRTLEARGLVTQSSGRGFEAGLGLMRLMPRAGQALLEPARPVVAELARRAGASAVLSIRERDDEVVVLAEQPRTGGPYISFREGSSVPLGAAASSLALLSVAPEQPGEHAAVTAARAAGDLAVLRSSGELRAATTGLAVAWRGVPACALAVVFFDGAVDEESVSALVVAAARRLAGVPQAP
jgi:DNA-binding IclR family transcriptional regulator